MRVALRPKSCWSSKSTVWQRCGRVARWRQSAVWVTGGHNISQTPDAWFDGRIAASRRRGRGAGRRRRGSVCAAGQDVRRGRAPWWTERDRGARRRRPRAGRRTREALPLRVAGAADPAVPLVTRVQVAHAACNTQNKDIGLD